LTDALERATPMRLAPRVRSRAILAALSVAALLLLDLFPGIDLRVSGWFYRSDAGFPLASLPLFSLAMKGLPLLEIGGAILIGALGVAALIKRHAQFGITPRLALYIVSSLVIGPGLLANSVFKDHWGRARPHQIIEFGGVAHFTPVLELADQCTRNCSFPSGHGALGFWTITLVALVPEKWRNRALAGAIAVGVAIGLMRIAQGGHYLSDVVAAAILVVAVNWTLKYLILTPVGRQG
jgi:lipid A 4'-phosphatase